jgi:hypothetical protein
MGTKFLILKIGKVEMASKKPAKRNVSNSTPTTKQNEVIGKPVYYLGLIDAVFSCPTCNRKVGKGIIYEDNGKTFCSRRCIRNTEKAA